MFKIQINKALKKYLILIKIFLKVKPNIIIKNYNNFILKINKKEQIFNYKKIKYK